MVEIKHEKEGFLQYSPLNGRTSRRDPNQYDVPHKRKAHKIRLGFSTVLGG